MHKIEVSVVIPAFNAENTICATLDSVKGQTGKEYIREVIIVDDGSEDGTAKRVKEWARNNTALGFDVILLFQKNGGVSKARNAGVSHSKADYIAFLDSDDVWDETKLAKQCHIIEAYPQIHMLGTGWKGRNRFPGRRIRNRKGYPLYGMSVRDELIKYWPHTSSVLVRKDDLEVVGGFDESRRYGEDGDLFCKLADLRGCVYYTSEELVDCGNGKNPFGEAGLSSELLKMHRGFLKNVRNCYCRGNINAVEFMVFTVWEYMKFIRRCIIVIPRKLRNRM